MIKYEREDSDERDLGYFSLQGRWLKAAVLLAWFAVLITMCPFHPWNDFFRVFRIFFALLGGFLFTSYILCGEEDLRNHYSNTFGDERVNPHRGMILEAKSFWGLVAMCALLAWGSWYGFYNPCEDC